jgi:Xaa-Pro aminopeptidase
MSDEVADPRLAIQIQTGFEKDYVIKNRTAIMFDCHGVWSHYCWDGGKTWVVGDDPTPRMSLVATAAGNAILEIIGQMRPGIRVSELQAVGRRALAKSGLARPEDALVYFHGLGLEHHDLELPQSKEFEDQNRFDWTLEEGMVVAVHIAIGGDTEDRYYTEDIALVTRHAGEGFFKWGPGPLLNSA